MQRLRPAQLAQQPAFPFEALHLDNCGSRTELLSNQVLNMMRQVVKLKMLSRKSTG